ncbi:MAG: glutamate racemase [Spirochaetales bacterium]|nr:glutamate racemase [Spirochaetales bacterium]
MKSRPIIFFDSGVGGLPYLALARERLPAERFVYVADRGHYPYGEKTVTELRAVVLEVFGRAAERFSPKLGVVACNTASVAALDALRAAFDPPFVGVVPAVKPAAAFSKNKRIGVLATPQTVKNDYLDALVRDFAEGCEVVRIPAPRLRDFVETRLFDAPAAEKDEVIGEAAGAVRASGADVVVLGCTHYLHVAAELEAALGPSVRIIDSREGVVNQLVRVLDGSRLRAAKRDGEDGFFLTGEAPVEERYRRFAERFGFAGAEIL